MKRLNVYDSVNRNRLLGTHPRWAEPNDHYRFATFPRVPISVMNGDWMEDTVGVTYVQLQRVCTFTEGGWEAEVSLVTYSPLKDLMHLRDFRLPGENEMTAGHRRDMQYYSGIDFE